LGGAAAAALQKKTTTAAYSLPSGWVSSVEEKTGAIYYFHAASGKTSWTRPTATETAIPVAAADEKAATKSELEKGLPTGWTVMFDDEGDPYYVSPTMETFWFRPNPDGTVGSGEE
jgi:hypothetical protein